MTPTNHSRGARSGAGALAIALALSLSACGGMATNRSLDSVHQPVVEHTNYTFDVPTLPEGGIDPGQRHRLAEWFGALGLKYGDHVALDDPAQSVGTHNALEMVAGQFGLIVEGTAPVTEGVVAPGTARVVVSRTFASVPGCPDWSGKSDANFNNATSRNFGCAVNSNRAAMVANKEDLIHGQSGTGDTVVLTNTKAIDTYRTKAPSGTAGLKATSTQSN